MTDFFNNQTEPNQEPETTEQEPTESTLKVGDKEYTQDELNELVNLGHIAKEAEERYDTRIDRVYPEYTKTRQEVKELKSQIAQMQQQVATTGEIDPSDLAEARKAAKRLGLITIDDIKELGILTEPDLEAKLAMDKQVDQLIGTCKKLEKEIDGSDGRPKFDTQKVFEYMEDNGLKNPMFAYKEMNEKALDEWKTREITKKVKPGMYSERVSTAGSKKPAEAKITKDNILQATREALYGSSE